MTIPSTQLGARFEPGNTDLVMEKRYPVRSPGKDEVLLKVSACGVCHTDVFWLSGAIGARDTNTYLMGHEVAGVPVELGEGVSPEKIHIGKLYSVLFAAPCLSGLFGAFGGDGGYAEFITVSQNSLVEVPAGVSVEEAAISSDAGITTYHAVRTTAGITPGSNLKVLIFGIGGLGHLAIQYAKHFGAATVYACDIKPKARKLAAEVGADEVYDLLELEKKIQEEKLTVDVTIDFAVTSQTFALSLGALSNKTGEFVLRQPKAVIVGISQESLTFNSADSALDGIQILTSVYGTREDLEDVLKLFAKGIIKGHVKAEPLENVNTILDELRAYEVDGRKVVVPRSRSDC